MTDAFVIGHRGFPEVAPENTLVSFERAIAAGVRMVECDVALSQDGEVVVIHDDTLDRTTDGKGPVSARTLAELKALDAGAWFGRAFAGERIPTLAELLQLTRDRGVAINVEIKAEAVTRGKAAGGIEEKVAVLVAAAGMERATVVSSFEALAIARMREVHPRLPTAFLIDGKMARPAAEYAEKLACGALHLSARKNGESQVKGVKAAGLDVRLYTVNDPEMARRYWDWGVTAIFTDRVAEMLGVPGLTP